ncbi:MAG: hypothetical protein L6Q66_05315 [Bacteroidia bacterium]|nr:hypothetical protein [Bacteroidia bacterium]
MDIVKTIKSSSRIKAEDHKSAIEKYWLLVDEYIAEQTNLLLMSQFEPDKDIKINFLELKLRKKIYGNDILAIINAYFEFRQENDIEIIQKFKDTFDFKKHELLYFIPREIIYDEITRINRSKDVRVNPTTFFKLIEFHFKYKIINLVLLHFKLETKKKSGKKYNNFHSNMYDKYRNFKNAMHGKGKDETILKYINSIYEFESYIIPGDTVQDTWRIILDEAKGETEKSIIKELIENAFYYKCSKNKFYQLIFPLIKIILPDHSLLSEDKFLKNSIQSQAFNANYKSYQVNKIRKIISYKKKLSLLGPDIYCPPL